MGLIGREIIQSRTYDDPNVKPLPNLNYKETFPITVFEAVRLSMTDPNSLTLMQALEQIQVELRNKQPIFPGKSANFLMTFAGTPGEVGSIRMSRDIPWDPTQQSHDRIPTEKAVGDLMFKLGLVDEEGRPVNDPESKHVRWSDIIGRPLMYTGPGNNEDGFMTQKAVTSLLNALNDRVDAVGGLNESIFNKFVDQFGDHMRDHDNPHGLTPEQIGALPADMLRVHIEETVNPHNITAELLGLGNVNNTSDMDKPISRATQDAIDIINDKIAAINGHMGDMDFVIGADYNQESGQFIITFRSGETLVLHIPINGLIDEIGYDPETKEIVFYEIGGTQKRIDISELFIRYLGSEGAAIKIIIDDTDDKSEKIIRAEIRSKSITAEMLADGIIGLESIIDGTITSDKIADLTIITEKLADESVTTEKVSKKAIINALIGDRAVNGRTLFSSPIPHRVLAVLDANSDPVWTGITDKMINDDAVQNRHIQNFSITTSKLVDLSVTTPKIQDYAVTEVKIGTGAVTNTKLGSKSVTTDKLASDLLLPGTPKIGVRPSADVDNSEIPDTHWVREAMSVYVASTRNIGDRAVTGQKLFTSETKDRILGVVAPGEDPIWTTVNAGMMGRNAVYNAAIQDLSVTGIKIASLSIEERHITNNSIVNSHLTDSSVDGRVLWKAPGKDFVIASLSKDGTPGYSKVTKEMMGVDAVTSDSIKNLSIKPSKIESSIDRNVVLGVTVPGTYPMWTKITTDMMMQRSVDASVFMSSPTSKTVLTIDKSGDDAQWTKVDHEYIKDGGIQHHNMAPDSVGSDQIIDKSIKGSHFADWSIPPTAIEPHSITGLHLKPASVPFQVMAVIDPWTDPVWSSIQTEMIQDKAITKEKMMQSVTPYRVIGTTQANVPPEYLMITHQFIVDNTILGSKLEPNIALLGTPELTTHPAVDADNFQLASTKWVRKTIRDLFIHVLPAVVEAAKDPDSAMYPIEDMIPEGKDDAIPPATGESFEFDYGSGIIRLPIIQTAMIADRAVTGRKLFSSKYAPRVLGITEPWADPEYLLVEEAMIADGAVTENKIARSVHLLGSPEVEVRPSPDACDNKGGGRQIPDCQWVLDRIRDALDGFTPSGGGSGSGSGSGTALSGNLSVTDRVISSVVNSAYNSTAHSDEAKLQVPSTGDNDYHQFDGSEEHTGVTDRKVVGIVGTAYNETVHGDCETKVPVEPTDESDYVPVSGVDVAVSDKVVSNLVNGGYNNSDTGLGSPQAPISPTNDSDYSSASLAPPPSEDGGDDSGSGSTGGSGGGNLRPGSVTSEHIQKRAVTMDKLETSLFANRVLAVLSPNADPKWSRINNEMLEDRSVDARNFMTSATANRVLAILEPNADPVYTTINRKMLEAKIIGTEQLIDESVTDTKIARKSIDRKHLMDKPMIEEQLIVDGAVTTQKIKDQAVMHRSIAPDAVDGEQIVQNVELRGNPTVKANTNYQKRSLRNIILSPDKPTTGEGFQNGDIWFQYI